MAEMTIPPWLTRDYDPVGTFVKSYQIGANISMEQSRLAEQQRQANMEAEYKREQMAANIIKAQQDLAVDQAKNNQDIEFKQKQLAQQKQIADASAAQAALTARAQQEHWRALEEAAKPKPQLVRRPDGSSYLAYPDGTTKEVGIGTTKPTQPVPFDVGGNKVWQFPNGRVIPESSLAPKPRPEEYKTVTKDFEESPEIPEVPYAPAKTNWYGRVTPAVPYKPAVPAQPARKEVMKVPVTSSDMPIPESKPLTETNKEAQVQAILNDYKTHKIDKATAKARLNALGIK